MKKLLVIFLLIIVGLSYLLFKKNVNAELLGAVQGKTYKFISNESDPNLRDINTSETVTKVETDTFSLFDLREKIESIKAQISALQGEQTKLEVLYNEAKLKLNIP